jgi:hypothetical protein
MITTLQVIGYATLICSASVLGWMLLGWLDGRRK